LSEDDEDDDRVESKRSAVDESKMAADGDASESKGNDDLPFGPPRTFDPSFTPVCSCVLEGRMLTLL
jgi:hypothetical protein